MASTIGLILAIIVAPGLLIAWSISERKPTTKQWAALTGILLAAGLLTRILVIAVIAGMVLLALLVAWLWHRVILADVTYGRVFSRTHVFPGESVDVTWTIANEKPLPISWLRWQEQLPTNSPLRDIDSAGLQFDAFESRRKLASRHEGLDEVTTLRGYETVVRTTPVHALRRGYYRFGPATWHASDALGLYTATTEINDVSALTVYPSLDVAKPLEIQIRSLLGDWRRRNSLVEDPIWFRGDRDYRSNDPLKNIDWRASARTNSVQVKTFETTVHPKLMILVNLHAFEAVAHGWVTEYMENVISTGAAIALWALEGDYQVGIHSNGALPDAHVPYRILPSSGENQGFLILDYLARIVLVINRPVEDSLADLDDLPHGTATIICTNVVTQGLLNALAGQSRGRDISLVLVDNDTEFSIPGVPIIHTKSSVEAA